MEKNLEMQTSLLEDSLANPGQLQENSEEIQMTVISGTKWLGLLKTYDLDGSLGKMCEALLTCQWASKEVSLTWRVSDTKPHHLLFQLAPQMPNTDENDVGLWATPNTMDHLPQRSEEATIRMMNGHRKGRSKPSNLREQVDENTMKMWPTPTATPRGAHTGKMSGSVSEDGKTSIRGNGTKFGATLQTAVAMAEKKKREMYPTPTARDYKDSGENLDLYRSKRQDTQLGVIVKRMSEIDDSKSDQDQSGGSLNPEWVEWLMGYPIGHTE
jgi:DNA (cytosine-5)-methyltransferase 1